MNITQSELNSKANEIDTGLEDLLEAKGLDMATFEIAKNELNVFSEYPERFDELDVKWGKLVDALNKYVKLALITHSEFQTQKLSN